MEEHCFEMHQVCLTCSNLSIVKREIGSWTETIVGPFLTLLACRMRQRLANAGQLRCAFSRAHATSDGLSRASSAWAYTGPCISILHRVLSLKKPSNYAYDTLLEVASPDPECCSFDYDMSRL